MESEKGCKLECPTEFLKAWQRGYQRAVTREDKLADVWVDWWGSLLV
jgi:hypothetical protein